MPFPTFKLSAKYPRQPCSSFRALGLLQGLALHTPSSEYYDSSTSCTDIVKVSWTSAAAQVFSIMSVCCD